MVKRAKGKYWNQWRKNKRGIQCHSKVSNLSLNLVRITTSYNNTIETIISFENWQCTIKIAQTTSPKKIPQKILLSRNYPDNQKNNIHNAVLPRHLDESRWIRFLFPSTPCFSWGHDLREIMDRELFGDFFGTWNNWNVSPFKVEVFEVMWWILSLQLRKLTWP